jgi:hypothetical protein
MSESSNSHERVLARDILVLQLKLVIEAARDLLLSPLSLAAALLDVMLSKRQEPRYFRAVLDFGRRSDEWIDLWAAARGPSRQAQGAVDSVLNNVEEVLRDPQAGARRAKVLKRWAERQMSRARRNVDQRLPPSR